MQESQQLISILHIANPGIPAPVFETVAESGEHEDDGEDRVGWVCACDDVGDDFAEGGDDGYAELAETHVHFVVEEGGCGLWKGGLVICSR